MKKLYRSYNDRIIGGVGGGLAEYFEVDPVLVRAVIIILSFVYGTGFLIYLLLWIIVPMAPYDPYSAYQAYDPNYPGNPANQPPYEFPTEEKPKAGLKVYFGLFLVVLGIFFFIDEIVPNMDDYFFPVILISIGGFILYNSRNKKKGGQDDFS